MRFKFKRVKPSHGDERIVTKYAWYPMSIKNDVRWFEWVKVRQRYVGTWDGSVWVDLEFIDE